MNEKDAHRAYIKKEDPSPLYYKFQIELKKKIESDQFAPGDMIPPERKIAKEYNISLGTVRKAILNLVSEGFLYRIQGKGTMVAGSSIIRKNIRYYRFRKDFFDKNNPNHKIKLLDISKIPGEVKINHLLKIKPQKDLYLIKRRFIHQTIPYIYSISYLEYDKFSSLKKFSRFHFEKVPFYTFLEDKFGIPTLSNRELISAVAAEQEVAEVLSIIPGDLVLKIEMLSYTYKKKPYEYRICYCLTENRSLLREY